MADAFTFIFSVVSQLVTWLFSSAVSIELSSYVAPVGAILCASTILSVIVGSLLSYFKGRPSMDFPTRVSTIGKIRSSRRR